MSLSSIAAEPATSPRSADPVRPAVRGAFDFASWLAAGIFGPALSAAYLWRQLQKTQFADGLADHLVGSFALLTVLACVAVFVVWSRALQPLLSPWRRSHYIPLFALLLAAAGMAAIGPPTPKPMSWFTEDGNRAPQSPRTGWQEEHVALELHAQGGGDASFVWRAQADVPAVYRRLNGKLHLAIAQPAWVVLDSLGQPFRGPDGVQWRLLGQGDGVLTQLGAGFLNAHANAADRRWHDVTVDIPPDVRHVAIEVLAGPPNSNNWNDRLWIEVKAKADVAGWAARFAGLMTILFLACVLASLAMSLRRWRAANGQAPWGATSPTPTRELITDMLFIVVVLAIPIALYVGTLGFYSDDWDFLRILSSSPHLSVGGFYTEAPNMAGRPIHALLLIWLYKLFGLNPLPYHLVVASFLIATCLLFYLVLRELRVPSALAVALPVVYGLLPHYAGGRFWITVLIAPLSVALYFASLYAELRVVRVDSRQPLLWKLCALLLLIAAGYTYEVVLPLFFLNPLLVYFATRGDASARAALANFRRRALVMGSTIVTAMGVLALKAVTVPRGDGVTGAEVLTLVKKSFALDYAPESYGLNWWHAFGVAFGQLGVDLPLTLAAALASGTDRLTVAAAVLIAFLVFGYTRNKPRGNAAEWGAALSITGLIVFVAGYAIFEGVGDIAITASGIGNRTAIAAAIGVAITFTGVVVWLSALVSSERSRGFIFRGAIAALCATSAFLTLQLADYWQRAYAAEMRVLADLKTEIPAPPVDAILIDGVCPYIGPGVVLESFWEVKGALYFLYGEEDLRGDVITPTTRLDRDAVITETYGIPRRFEFGPGLVVYDAKRRARFALTSFDAAQRYFAGRPSSGDCDGRPGLGASVF